MSQKFKAQDRGRGQSLAKGRVKTRIEKMLSRKRQRQGSKNLGAKPGGGWESGPEGNKRKGIKKRDKKERKGEVGSIETERKRSIKKEK